MSILKQFLINLSKRSRNHHRKNKHRKRRSRPMLKKLVNEAYCVLHITTTGPILIKSGYATVSGPDMTPVRTYRNGRLELFLPGSSLKGVFRSHLEKIICSLAPQVVCNPFLKQKRDEQSTTLEEEALRVYRYSCGDEVEK